MMKVEETKSHYVACSTLPLGKIGDLWGAGRKEHSKVTRKRAAFALVELGLGVEHLDLL